MFKIHIIILFIVLPSTLFSQREYHNWYFGDKSGITFNTPNEEPKILYGNLSWAIENTSIISDYGGNLLYYSTINCIYDIDRKIFCDKDTIAGDWSSSQGSVLVSIDTNTFVRIGCNFKSDDLSAPTPLSFIVFQNKNENFQILKHDTIMVNYNSENIMVMKDFNSNSFYLVVNDRYESIYNLYKYDMTSQSFNLLQTLPSKFIFKMEDRIATTGFLKSSLSGKLLASFHHMLGIEIIEFDNEKEKLNFKSIIRNEVSKDNMDFYSGEFSPNGDYLFFTNRGENTNYLSRITIPIDNSQPQIDNLFEINNFISNLLLGPNFKIYFAGLTATHFTSLETPNNQYDIGFKLKSLDMYNTISTLSFPNIPTTYYNLLKLSDTTFACLNRVVQFKSELYAPFKDTIYSWTGPNDFVSNLPNPIISNVSKNDEGYYYLKVFNGDSSISYERKTYLKVFPDPIPEITVKPDTTICNSDFANLTVPLTYQDFEWTTGEKTHLITVLESGVYGVTYTNENGCSGYAEVNITFEKDLTTNILGETKICDGSYTTLSADSDYESYLWSTEETTKSIEVDKVGEYILTVETSKGCIIKDTVEVTNHPFLDAQLNPTPTTICSGDSTLLQSRYDLPYYSYKWNTGAKTRGIYVSQSSTYKLIITDTRTGCYDSTEIAIKVEDNLQPTITGSNICSGESATLEALPNDPSYTYKWSNGEETPVIEVNQAGTYTVKVSKAGCEGTAEFTVNESPTPEFVILGENIICNNETATLSSSKEFAEYLWSTNEITKEIDVTETGTYTLTVTDENGCSSSETFTVEKYELKFDISKRSIDFGKVYITENPMDTVKVVNNSGSDVLFEAGSNFIKVFDGQTYSIIYTLTPNQLGFYQEELQLIVTEPCDTVITIPITAGVYARTTISTEDIYTQIGQTETIPVYLECEADLPAQEYSITTDIDRSAFYTNDSYTINQKQQINKVKSKIHDLTGTILLSESLEYDITFPNYNFTNPYIEVILIPGKIFIDSICAFPLRNITTFEETTLSINPNPASEQLNIDITTGVQGTMKLELVSTDGRVIYSDNWQQSTKSKQMQINTINIPSGLYQVRLITPYDAITKSVVVVE